MKITVTNQVEKFMVENIGELTTEKIKTDLISLMLNDKLEITESIELYGVTILYERVVTDFKNLIFEIDIFDCYL